MLHDAVIGRWAKELARREVGAKGSAESVSTMLQSLSVKQTEFVTSDFRFSSLLGPRRSGKTHSLVAKALIQNERNPGSRVLVVCFSKAYGRENYWVRSKEGGAAPGGFVDQGKVHSLGLEYNLASMSWVHKNGSTGIVTGAATMDELEKLRGAPAEADLIIVDECGSFDLPLLESLIQDILLPGLMSRGGRLVLAGTPGSIPAGIWYQASCLDSIASASYTCKRWDDTTEERAGAAWHRFGWTVQDNTAKPEQWAAALEMKKAFNWADDNPRWLREWLGQWVRDSGSLVFTFAAQRHKDPDAVLWKGGSLPRLMAPWTVICGVDWGYVDDTAFCVLAYSHTNHKVYNLYNFRSPYLSSTDILSKMQEIRSLYGVSIFVADTSNPVLVNELRKYGVAIVNAEKTQKSAFIELINSAFDASQIAVIEDSILEQEICKLRWNLEDGVGSSDEERKVWLAQRSKLKIADNQPNHISDAFIYGWRHCHSQFMRPMEDKVNANSDGITDVWAKGELQYKRRMEDVAGFQREWAALQTQVDEYMEEFANGKY
jgi:hypothetical protein